MASLYMRGATWNATCPRANHGELCGRNGAGGVTLLGVPVGSCVRRVSGGTWWANMLVPLSILTTTSLCMTLGVLHLICLRWVQGVTLRTQLAVGLYVIMISSPIVTLCFTALVVTGVVSWIQFTSWPGWAPFVCPSEASSCPYHCSNARQYPLPEPEIYFVF